MVEKKTSVEELTKRLDSLLDVLSLIVKDLREVTESLKAPGLKPLGKELAPPAEKFEELKDVRSMFPQELEEMLSFEERGESIIIKPRQYLGSDNFAKIASIIRDAHGEYISAGKDSHFRLPKTPE